jgi:hypothetical protein
VSVCLLSSTKLLAITLRTHFAALSVNDCEQCHYANRMHGTIALQRGAVTGSS